MTTYNFGDVVLVPFPFSDQSAIKKRPAIVASSDEYSHRRPDIVIMAVTSQTRWAATRPDRRPGGGPTSPCLP